MTGMYFNTAQLSTAGRALKRNNKFHILLITILTSILFSSNTGISQDFSFTWGYQSNWFPGEKSPKPCCFNYSVLIGRHGNNSFTTIIRTGKLYNGEKLTGGQFTFKTDTTTCLLDSSEASRLFIFLKTYPFTAKIGPRMIPQGRKYFKTELIDNGTRLVIESDTIRKELLWGFGYTFDPDSLSVYREIYLQIYIDGEIEVSGKFETENKISYYTLSGRYTIQDVTLINLVIQLIRTYDNQHDHTELIELYGNREPNE